MVSPEAKSPSSRETGKRSPRMQGLPVQTLGSTVIRSNFMRYSPPKLPHGWLSSIFFPLKKISDFVASLKFLYVKSLLTEYPILLYIYNKKINNVYDLLPLLDGIICVSDPKHIETSHILKVK